jgi:hypothetical protein
MLLLLLLLLLMMMIMMTTTNLLSRLAEVVKFLTDRRPVRVAAQTSCVVTEVRHVSSQFL